MKLKDLDIWQMKQLAKELRSIAGTTAVLIVNIRAECVGEPLLDCSVWDACAREYTPFSQDDTVEQVLGSTRVLAAKSLLISAGYGVTRPKAQASKAAEGANDAVV